MTPTATLRTTFESPSVAQRAAHALGPDDDAFVHTAVRGSTLEVRVTAPDAPGLLRALDDALAQLAVFEDLLRDARGASSRA